MKDLKQLTGKDAHFLELELANLASVRRAAKSFLEWVSFRIIYHPTAILITTLLLQEGDKAARVV